MPTTPRRIVPDGGLVTTPDPFLAKDGDLVRADDGEYVPFDPAIRKVAGRAAFNATPEAGAIVGVTFIDTPTGGRQIIVHTGTAYRAAAAGATGAFADLFTGLTGGSILESAHLAQHAVLANGVDTLRVVGTDFPSGGKVGLPQTTLPPTLADVGAGFTLSNGKKVRYWIEERVKSGSGVVLKRSGAKAPAEGTKFGNAVAEFTGDGTSVLIRATRPALDSETTHWALFATATDGVFPNGAEIAEAAAATTTIDDTRAGTNPGLPAGAAYEKVSLVYQGISQIIPRNDPPPIAATMDVFEDQIVSDDSTDPERIRWCYPGRIHSWPASFFARPGAGSIRGRVQIIRRVGDVLVVALDTRIMKVSILPQEPDDVFQPERVMEPIINSRGVVGRKAGCVFQYRGASLFAYISPEGVVGTDGDRWFDLVSGLDWRALVEDSQATKFVLVDDPAKFRLIAGYVPKGGTKVTRAIYLSYHPTQLKDGVFLKPTGPVVWEANAASFGLAGGRFRLFAGRDDGVLYLEDQGITRPAADGGFNFVVEHAERYFAGLGNAARLQRAWVNHSGGVAGQTATVTLTRFNSEQDPQEVNSPPQSVAKRGNIRVASNAAAEGHRLRFVNTDSLGSVRVNGFFYEVEEMLPV